MAIHVDFIFSQEGLVEENGVISLNVHTDSLRKVTTVRLPEYSEILRPNSEIKEIVASSMGPCVSTTTG